MGRTINHIERVSESFDACTASTKASIVAELFTRLDVAQSAEAMMLMTFWAKRQAREAGRNGAEIPPLMERAEVERAGKLALEPAKGGAQ